ncbi:MAG: SprB repeat-containing protein, partial [Flavobacteriales bacterium]|nr:SprB repeat-containing protein [Flavobacteriales bacterium]
MLPLGPIELTTPDEIDLDISIGQILCNGEETGSISLAITGGVEPYNVSWTGPAGFTSNDQNISNLGAGTYTLLVTDDLGCEASASVDIIEPQELTLTETISDVFCADDPIDISILIQGGAPNYTVTWTGPNGFNSDQTSLSNLEQGSYTVTIQDANGCEIEQTYDLIAPNPITVTETIVDLDCNGDPIGSIEIVVSGGLPPYNVNWTGPNGFNSIDLLIENLESGDYDLLVNDQQNCEFEATYTVAQPPAFELNEVVTNPLCNGENTGSIAMSVTGGDGNYTITWTGPNGYSSAAESINNLFAGEYFLMLVDGTGCLLETSFTLVDPQLIDASETSTPVSCFGLNDGSIQLNITGGTPNYTVDWTGPNGYNGNGEFIDNLESGTYDATITDQAGCQTTLEVIIDQPEEIVLDVSSENTTCNEANGSVSVTITGGVEPYSITWLDSDNNPISNDLDVFNLEAGTYTVQVSDANNCDVESGAVISDSDVMTITGSTTEPLCSGDSNGTITIEVMGGIGTLDFEWTGPNGFTSTDQNISDLSSGTYVVQVTDENGCVSAEQFDLNEPDSIQIDATVSDISCFGQEDGSIEISISGGAPNYTIAWTGPNGFVSDELIILDLSPGTYSVAVIDQNNCEALDQFEILEDSELVLNATGTTLVCFGDTNGSIDLEITGGTPPYDITWTDSNGVLSNNEDLNNLGPDTYTAVVLDNAGCDAQIEVVIEENPDLEITMDVTQPACLSSDGVLTANVSGGTEPYQYSWFDQDNGNALIGTDPTLAGLSS